MRYTKIVITADRQSSEELQAALLENGFVSMQIDDSAVARDILSDPGLYKYDYLNEEIEDLAKEKTDEIAVTLYFSDDEEGRGELQRAEDLLERLKESGTGIRDLETAPAGDDSEWLYKWQENYKPAKVGERIVVKPSWEDYEPAEGELVIEMDPGMAFGSGLHETTSMCIRALEKALGGGYEGFGHGEEIKVLDVGTGTGILAIAAALLGASDCLGIDIDDEAVRVGTENVIRNGLEEKIRIAKGDLVEGVDYKADILAANLMADLVMKLAPAASRHLGPGGLFISSGILDIKEDAVSKAVSDAGFEIKSVLEEGEWRAIVAVRKASVL